MDIRSIRTEDIGWCQQLFDRSFADLHRRYGLDDGEPIDPDWLRPILVHILETDPSGTVLAMEGDDPVAFASTVRRDDYWFLSFLFVHPAVQGRGVGRGLLEHLLPQDPAVVRATVVESFQPASTGLYAHVGMSPQAVKYWLSGVSRPGSLPTLPSDLHRAGASDEDQGDIDGLDRSILGFTRSADHGWWRRGGTPCWSYRRGSDLVAYAYVDDGYVGPVLANDERTLCAVVADLIGTADDPRRMSINLCGNSTDLFRTLVDAGARIDDSTSYRFVYCSSHGPLPPSYVHHSDWLP